MRGRLAPLAPLLAGLLACAGCGRAPKRDLARARAAIEKARAAGAPLYAPASFADAVRTAEDSEHLLRERKYGDARMMARDALSRAQAAQRLSGENREKMAEAVRARIRDSVPKLAGVEREIADAEKRGVAPDHVALFRADLAEARAKYGKAQDLLAHGEILPAKTAAGDAETAADVVLREVRFAVASEIPEKTRRRRRR